MCKFSIVFIILFFSFACKSKHDELNFIHLKKEDSLKFSDVFISSELIFLEEIEDNQVFKIDKLIATENMLFIGDIEMSEGLFAFDKSGNFLWNIYSSIGAPGEFMELSDFDVNEKEEKVMVLSASQGRVFIYDFAGNYIEDFKIPNQLIVHNLASLGDNKYIFYRDLIKESKEDYPYQLISFDMRTNQYIDQEFPIPARLLTHSQDFNISRNADKLFISQVYSPKIFLSSSSGKFTEYLNFNGFDNIDKLDEIEDYEQFRQAILTNQYRIFLGMFLSGDDFTSFVFREDNVPMIYFENNRTNFSGAFKRFENDIQNYPISSFMNSYGDEIFAQIDEEIFTYYSSSLPESYLANTLKMNNQSLSPVIVKLKLK